MAHYALLDENNVVVNVFEGKEPNDLSDGVTNWETFYGEHHNMTCKRTCFDGTTCGFRKNPAAIGAKYDSVRDAFIPAQPYLSWTLNEDTCVWEPPTPYPTDGKQYGWFEYNKEWIEGK
jgi:hypothetical protein